MLQEWSPEVEEGEYSAKLRSGFTEIHIATLVHLTQQHGWKGNLRTGEETYARLAALSPPEYDRSRKEEAKRLGVRTETLDAEVAKCRSQGNIRTQGSAVDFPDVEPWGTAVNGAELLDEVAARYSHYVALPPGAADALALHTAHTHCFDAFEHTPRLNYSSPEKGCGKTTLLDVQASMVPRPLRAENITAAVFFRLIEKHKPTLLLDEVDTYLNDNEEVRGLLNAGHKRGGKAYRCEGDNNDVRGFNVFAPAVLAGIGTIPGTLHDRSIVIKLVRARPGEVGARFDSRHVEVEQILCRKLARWSADNFDELKECDPKLPGTAFNRLADNWRPLFAIAEKAGGNWPGRCAEAFSKLTSTDDLDAQGVGTMLLADIAVIFATKEADKLPSLGEALSAIEAGETIDQLPSAGLAKALEAIEGRPWAEWGKNRKPISVNQLANQLHRFGIKPKPIRIGKKTPRGYKLADFRDAFGRYLPSMTPFPECNTATTPGKTPVSRVQQPTSVLHPEEGVLQRECCGVAVQEGGIAGGGVMEEAPQRAKAEPDKEVIAGEAGREATVPVMITRSDGGRFSGDGVQPSRDPLHEAAKSE